MILCKTIHTFHKMNRNNTTFSNKILIISSEYKQRMLKNIFLK